LTPNSAEVSQKKWRGSQLQELRNPEPIIHLNTISDIPVVNDAQMVDALIDSAGKVILPEDIITNAEPSMLAEDFAYYAQQVPGVYFHLGCRDPKCEVPANLHSSKFTVDEACIRTGIEIISKFALDYLGNAR
jgi:amidohydrolase